MLATAKPERLAALDTKGLAAAIADIYVNLDYIHPFPDGNSRTLRTFTAQLAEASGYKIDWERSNQTQITRDALCIARDKSVNDMALPNADHETTMRKIIASVTQYRNDPALPELLERAIRPLRAVAFETLPEAEALKAHPELKGSYDALKSMTAHLQQKQEKLEGKTGAAKFQNAVMIRVKSDIVKRLNTGAVLRPAAPKQQPPTQQPLDAGPTR